MTTPAGISQEDDLELSAEFSTTSSSDPFGDSCFAQADNSIGELIVTAEDSAATCLNYWHIQRLPEPQQPQEIVVDPAGNNPVIVTSTAVGVNNSASSGLATNTFQILLAAEYKPMGHY